MSAGQLISDELAANQVCFDLERCSEPAVNGDWANDIKIDQSQRVLISPARSDGQAGYRAIMGIIDEPVAKKKAA
jgi:hypothetical protein